MFKQFFKKKSTTQNLIINHNECQDFTQNDLDIIDRIKPFTMTSMERIKTLLDAVEYINNYKIEGDYVECGTWKGGSVMGMLLKQLDYGSVNKDIWIFDTFSGMSNPLEIDKDCNDQNAVDLLSNSDMLISHVWAYSSFEETSKNILSTGYPSEKIHFIKGMVEETVPNTCVEKISLLRLDTDWYESTKIELEYLFPKLVSGGILIIDDYGHWKGCKQAVDEYFAKINYPAFLSRIDYTGRVLIKK